MNELIISIGLGFTLTLFIYSYLVGDNPLYRLAVHLLVGVSAGYTAVVVTKSVIFPVFEQIRQNPSSRESFLWLVPILFAILLLLKRLPATAWLGNSTMALLMGVGAAVALLGAVQGTLLPQLTRSPQANPVQNLIIAILTGLTVISFQFTGTASGEPLTMVAKVQQGVATLGRVVLVMTLGALFAALLSSSLLILAERLLYFINGLAQLAS